MGEIKVDNKERVVPGEILATGMDYLPSYGTYRDGDNIVAKKVGLVSIEGNVIKLISVCGQYEPRRNDVVIGRIIDVLLSGWRVEFGSPYSAILPIKDASSEYIARGANLTRFFDIGDHVLLKITNVTSQKLIDVSTRGFGLKKLRGGQFVNVNAYKVPRIIGKNGSMVSMIKKATGASVVVGQNGIIWINSKDAKMELLAVEVIRKIEAEAHISGLTDKIKTYLEEKIGHPLEEEKQKTSSGKTDEKQGNDKKEEAQDDVQDDVQAE